MQLLLIYIQVITQLTDCSGTVILKQNSLKTSIHTESLRQA